jgi:hypothetical protein
MGDADFWDLLVKGGVPSDSATAIVQSHRGMDDAGLWDRLVHNGMSQDAATSAVHARGGAPAPNTDISMKNFGRSLLQGGSFGFSDEIGKALGAGQGPGGIADRDSEKAFKTAHPLVDLTGKVIGGAVAPAAAIAALPELGTGAGVAALAAGTGMLSGAGEGEGPWYSPSRVGGAALGGILGPAGVGAGMVASKVASPIVKAIASRIAPELMANRYLGNMARGLLDHPAAVQGEMDAANTLAPGSASPATTAIAKGGTDDSRFKQLIAAVGKSAEAGRNSEASIVGQQKQISAGLKSVGQKMNGLEQGAPITLDQDARNALVKVSDVLGSKSTPDVQTVGGQILNPQGVPYNPPTQTMSVADVRDALTQLRFMRRQIMSRPFDKINGGNLHDINQAEQALENVAYKARPDFAGLDQQYKQLAQQRDQAEDLLAVVQRSRSSHGANDALGLSAESRGGSLHGARSAITKALDAFMNNQKAVSDATARRIIRPGASIADLMAPGTGNAATRGAAAAAKGGLIALPPALRGLLTPYQQ